MPSPFSPHRDASIPTLTQRAEPTLSPDAPLPQDDGAPVLGDVYLGPDHGADDDVPVLSQPADGLPEPAPGTAASLPPHSYLELGPSAPYTPLRDRVGTAPPQAPPRYVPPVHPGLEPDLSPAPAAPPAAAPASPSASIPEAVLRAALQAEIEQAVHAAVQDASVLLRTRLEAELPAIVARTLGRVRPG
ncbi:Uncharacterised protein [Bordetella ansorpii]|uniref:Uncharacterized protein n=1 Tax=Bordetella ansorpii TaxID=288768 RepID=A0A157SUH2_9BORD|nr:hypothetical protein [Bordetella ansorpii]SAI73586.1 Uncharacterised protein [Bordetella ansorpii]